MVSFVTAVRDLNRLREIYAVLARHGFGEVVSRLRGRGKHTSEVPSEEAARGEEEKRRVGRGERVRMVLADLGPSFVKLGQILSTRPDVIPADIVAELRKLQDDVPPVPVADIREVIETALGAPVTEIFESFDEEPLAAASIAQVHRAVLRDGADRRQVVVKVQRPGIAQTIARDLELLHGLAALIERAIPESRIYSPTGLVRQFDRAITSELDFLVEADNARRFAQNFDGHPHVRFPRVWREASAKMVLTLEYLDGVKLQDAVAAGHSGPAIARRATGIIIKQIFEDGFFHADPHPGNVIILGKPGNGASESGGGPVLGMIDLGMVGRLSPELRDKTIDLMVAAVRKDYTAMADAMYAIGTPTKKIDMRAYRAEVAVLADKYLDRPLKEIELAAFVRDVVQGAQKYGLEVPPDFLMVGKALMTVEGVGKQLDPNLDVFAEVRPYFLDLLRKRYSPERIGNELWRGVDKLSTAAYELPQQMREILEDLRLGRLAVQTSDPGLQRAADSVGRHLFAGLVATSGFASGALLLVMGRQTWHLVAGVLFVLLGFLAIGLHLGRQALEWWYRR